jgi:hypothetical protein
MTVGVLRGGLLAVYVVANLCPPSELKGVDEKLAAESAFAKLEPELQRAQALWEKSDARAAPVDWTITRGLVAQRRMAGRNRFDGTRIVEVDLEHDNAVRFSSHDKFTLSAWIRSTSLTGAIVTRVQDVAQGQGYGLYLKDGRVQANLVKRWRDDALRLETAGAIDLNQWHNITMTFDGSAAAGGVKIYIDGQVQKISVNLDRLLGSFETSEPLRIGGGGGRENRFRGQIRAVRIYNVVLTPNEVAVVSEDTPISTLVLAKPEDRTTAGSDKIRFYFLERAAPPDIRNAWLRVIALRDR